ncbi:MAG TPA: GNAT family N-acetyltransferase [Burkholderiaceae bacterium]|nr:GNAT family N-acetyltransferase [Burkholderiaceae bacterium]
MAAVAIRRLVPANLPAYKSLRDAVLTAHPEAFTSDPAPERPPESYLPRLGLDRAEGGVFTLGAWEGARLVGAVSCERDPRAKVLHIGHLIGMMVRSDAQGRGIGRALLEACIAEARAARGLAMLTLTVTAGNDAAVHLYERAGFTRYGRLERAICVDGVYHAKDQMTLAL